MNNFAQARKALQASLESEGATYRQNAVYMEGMEAKLGLLKKQFEEFILGDGGLETFIKGLIDLGTTILKVVNSLGGLQSVLTILNGLLLTGIINKYYTSFEKLIVAVRGSKNILELFKNVVRATTVSEEAQAKANVVVGETATGASVGVNILKASLLGVTIAITALIAIVNALKQKHEEEIQAQRDLITNTENEVKSLSELKDSLNSEELTREQLNSFISSSMLKTYKDEINAIEDVNEARQFAIDKIDEEMKARAQLLMTTGFEDYKKALEELSKPPVDNLSGWEGYWFWNSIDDINEITSKFNDVKLDNSSLENYANSLGKIVLKMEETDPKKYKSSIERINKALIEYDNVINEATDVTTAYEKAMEILGYKYDEDTGSLRELTTDELAEIQAKKQQQEEIKALRDLEEELTKENRQLANSLKLTTKELNKLTLVAGGDQSKLNQLLTTMSELQTEIDEGVNELNNFQKTWDVLNTAIEEVNSSGEISINTFESLMSANSDFLSIIDVENGKLVVNKDYLDNRVEALKQSKIAALQDAMANDIEAYALGNVSELSITAQTAVSDLSTNVEDLGTKASETSGELLHLSYSTATLYEATNGDQEEIQKRIDGIHAIYNAYEELAQQSNNWKVDTTSGYSNKTTKGGSKTEPDKNKEAYEKALSAEELAYERHEVTIEQHIDRLQKIRDKYLTNTKENETKYWKEIDSIDKKIYNLKEQSWKENYEAERKALDEQLEYKEITEKEYIKRLKALSKQYLKDTKAHKEEFKKEIEEIDKIVKDYNLNKSLNTFKKKYDKLKHQREMDLISEKEYYDKLLELENKYLKDSKEHRERFKEEIWNIDEELHEGRLKLLEDEIDKYEKLLDRYKDALEDERDRQKDAIDVQIKDLEKLKESKKEYWENEIKALEEEHNKLKENNELMEKQDALARAKSLRQMVLKDGKFQYTQNESEIENAEKALIDYQIEQEYKRQKELLEDKKKQDEEHYKNQIEALKEEKETVEREFKDLINKVEDSKKSLDFNFSNLQNLTNRELDETQSKLDVFKSSTNGLLQQIIAKIGNLNSSSSSSSGGGRAVTSDGEGVYDATTGKRISGVVYDSGVAGYINEYGNWYPIDPNEAEPRIFHPEPEGTGNRNVKVDTPKSTNSGIAYLANYTSTSSGLASANQALSNIQKSSSGTAGAIASALQKAMNAAAKAKHADGVASVPSDELAIVGEDPNKEIVLGSKINNGSLMSLKAGTGVVNASGTRTLAGILNSLKGANLGLTDRTIDNGQVINISNISLPQVTNGQEFIQYLQNFSADMTQRAYAR